MRESPEALFARPVIHNPKEIERLRSLGLETITHEDFGRWPASGPDSGRHGEPPSTYAAARAHGITLIDATCPW